MSGAPNNIWGGLAQRGMDDEPADDFARPSIQRTVDAATAPPIALPGAVASPFHHPYVAGSSAATSTTADDEDADAATSPPPPPPPAGEASMPKPTAAKARKPKATQGANPQFQICALLMAKGELSREELAADVSCDSRPMQNALYNAKAAGRIVWIEKLDKYRITKEGREWASGGANLGNQRKVAQAELPPPQHHCAAPKEGRACRRHHAGAGAGRTACADDGGGAVVSLRCVQRRQLPPAKGRPGHRPDRCRTRRNAALPRTHGRAAGVSHPITTLTWSTNA